MGDKVHALKWMTKEHFWVQLLNNNNLITPICSKKDEKNHPKYTYRISIWYPRELLDNFHNKKAHNLSQVYFSFYNNINQNGETLDKMMDIVGGYREHDKFVKAKAKQIFF